MRQHNCYFQNSDEGRPLLRLDTLKVSSTLVSYKPYSIRINFIVITHERWPDNVINKIYRYV